MLFHDGDKIKRIEEEIECFKSGFAANGGDINFVKFERGVVYIHFFGSYVGYPSDPSAIVEMIELHLRMAVPGVDRVERV